MNSLAEIISIDKIVGKEIYACANEDEFNQFLKYNHDYTVLPHAGEVIPNPGMSDFKDRDNRDWNSLMIAIMGYVMEKPNWDIFH